MQEQKVQPMQEQEQIMIMLDGLYQNEDQDLLEQLVAEPTNIKNGSICYDYRPAPLPHGDLQNVDSVELKTSSHSTETCAESEGPLRRCFCSKTRCQKNYCECFKQGLPCTNDCQCLSCGNKEQLFLIRTSQNGTKCKCQKSHCLKKYCECHSSGNRCGPACGCLECENVEATMKEKLSHSCHEIDHLLCFNI